MFRGENKIWLEGEIKKCLKVLYRTLLQCFCQGNGSK